MPSRGVFRGGQSGHVPPPPRFLWANAPPRILKKKGEKRGKGGEKRGKEGKIDKNVTIFQNFGHFCRLKGVKRGENGGKVWKIYKICTFYQILGPICNLGGGGKKIFGVLRAPKFFLPPPPARICPPPRIPDLPPPRLISEYAPACDKILPCNFVFTPF